MILGNLLFNSNILQALIHLPDYTTATSVYPLFGFIHNMDLSESLSHSSNEINSLREKFNNKSYNKAFNK